jgi:hypothetical protein
MPDAPFVSGSEIVANPGNAALGYNGTGVEYGTNPADTNPFANVQGTLARIQDEDAKMRYVKHLEFRKDQEDLAQMLSSLKGNGSVFNMKGQDGKNVSFAPLPQDQQVLAEKADELRKLALKKPDSYSFDREFLKKKDEYDNLIAHAGMRSVSDAQNRLSAAQSMDPEDREGYLKHNKSEIEDKSLTDFHRPNPYMPNPKTDGENILSQKERLDKDNFAIRGTSITKEGNIDVQTDLTGLKDDIVDVRGKIKPGTKAFTEAVIMAQRFISSPNTQNPQVIIDMNKRIDANNAARGYKPGDAHYQPHVAEIKPDGTVGFTSTDPAQIAGAIIFESYGGLQPTKKPTKALAEQTKIDAQTNEVNTKIKNEQRTYQKIGAEIDHLHAQTDEAKARTAKLEGEAKKLAEKEQADIEEVNSPVASYLSVVTDANKKKFKAIPAGIAPALTNAGIDASQYTMTSINPSDEGVSHISGIQKTNDKGIATEGINAPSAAYYLKSNTGNPKNDMIAVSYKKSPTEIAWKTIKPNEAVENIIKSRKNFKNITDKTTATIGRSQNKLNEVWGKTTAEEAPTSTQRPTTVPAGAILKTTASGKYWVDKANRKVYDENGIEVIVK